MKYCPLRNFTYGDPLECLGKSKSFLDKQYPKLGQIPFDRQRKCRSTIHVIGGRNLVIVKGAPDAIFGKCINQSSVEGAAKAEIEMDGQVHSFVYGNELRYNQDVDVATVTLDRNGQFSIENNLPANCTMNSKQIWNLSTNQFVPVSTVMYSPNYWDDQSGIGHRHVFFMLKDCINDESPNGMYNEFLKPELVAHKRVFEALGSKLKVADSDDQLSGIGFSTTKRNNVIVKVKGATERVLNVKF